jgi:hypothetical protein
VFWLEASWLFIYIKYVLQLMKHMLAAMEKITVFVARCISLILWWLNYKRNSCNRMYFFLQMCFQVCNFKYDVMQQNSFNPMSNGAETLIIQHLRRVVPRTDVLLSTRTRVHHWNRQISGTHSKGLQEYLYITCCGISWLLVSYCIKFLNYVLRVYGCVLCQWIDKKNEWNKIK